MPALLTRLLSRLYAPRPDDALKARARLLAAATFVQAYRPGVANLLRALHAAGLNTTPRPDIHLMESVAPSGRNEQTNTD